MVGNSCHRGLPRGLSRPLHYDLRIVVFATPALRLRHHLRHYLRYYLRHYLRYYLRYYLRHFTSSSIGIYPVFLARMIEVDNLPLDHGSDHTDGSDRTDGTGRSQGPGTTGPDYGLATSRHTEAP